MLAPDDILKDRYRIVRRLSYGGMGAVYEARDQPLKRTVAIKETFANTEAGRTAFRREGQRLANLEHEVFPKVFDCFEENKILYLVMQFIPGEDLAERLKERINHNEGPFSPLTVLEWTDQLLDGLEMLHEHKPQIVHRDIKPSNLKLTPRGKIMLLDFGIAKGVTGMMSSTDGSIKAATPNFAPLEQILKIDHTSVEALSSIDTESLERILQNGSDGRSDLYSLGATMYCLMVGKLPADARLRASAIWSGKQDPLQPPSKLNPQVSQALSDILMRAMAVDPSDRINDSSTMRQTLREAVGVPAYISPTLVLPHESERARNIDAHPGAEAVTERFEAEQPKRAQQDTTQRDTDVRGRAEIRETIPVSLEDPSLVSEHQSEEQRQAALPIAPQQTIASISKAQGFAPFEQSVRYRALPPFIRQNKSSLLLSLIALVALFSLLLFWVSQGESNNDRSNNNSSTAKGPSQKAEELNVPAGNSNNAAALSDNQAVMTVSGMAYVPGGEFMMGRDGDRIGRASPAHKVKVNPFYIDLYEVTREDYQKCVDEKKCKSPSTWSSNKFPEGTGRLPVTGVTWDDATAYATWAGKRLPTEEEWEFAARGPKGFRYPWGNEWESGMANADSASKGVVEVGTYKGASPFGVYDMIGNAWEWTASSFSSYRSREDRADKSFKVIRGCMYGCNKDEATTTYRRPWHANGYTAANGYPNEDYSNTGFRCAKDAMK